MISELRNTKIEQATKMYDITDDDIRGWSEGQVHTTKTDIKGNFMDPEIFGYLNTPTEKMGYVELPIPVVNINYTYGEPVLHKILGISFKDLNDLIYYNAYIVVKSGNSKVKKGQFIYYANGLDNLKSVELKSGADAVEFLLNENNISDSEKYILHTLPVLPLQCRFLRNKNRYISQSINDLTFQIVSKSEQLESRLKRLNFLKAPDVVIAYEKRSFQELVDTYINNGARGIPKLLPNGKMIESCYELYSCISSNDDIRKKMFFPEILDEEKIILNKVISEYKINLFYDSDENFKKSEGKINLEFYMKKEKEKEEKLKDAFECIINKAIDLNFIDYDEFREDMVIAAKNTILDVVNCFFDQSEDNISRVQNAILAGLSCFVNKQIKLIGIKK